MHWILHPAMVSRLLDDAARLAESQIQCARPLPSLIYQLNSAPGPAAPCTVAASMLRASYALQDPRLCNAQVGQRILHCARGVTPEFLRK